MKKAAIVAILFGVMITPAGAELPKRLGNLQPEPSAMPDDVGLSRIDTPLARAVASDDPMRAARAAGLEVRNGRIGVEIVTDPSSAQELMRWLELAGASDVAQLGNLVEAFVTPQILAELDHRSDVSWVRRTPIVVIPTPTVEATGPLPFPIVSEGVEETNVTEWHGDGFTGAGVKIGVIDTQAYGWEDLLDTDLPSSTRFHYQRFGGGASAAGEVHGTAVAEIVHDMAPEAEIYLADLGSTQANFRDAVEWMLSEGVRVVAMSISYFGVGPGDGTGFFQTWIDTFVDQADGVWAHSAGNYRDSHWQGASVDADGNGWVELWPGEEVIWFGAQSSSDDDVRVSMQWNDWSVVDQDYSLHLFRLDNGEPVEVDSSDSLQTGQPGQRPTEFLSYTADEAGLYGVGIFRKNVGGTHDIEIFTLDQPLADPVAEGSLSTPGDAAGAMNTAAVNIGSFNVRPFSSAGPTNGPGGSLDGGDIKPNMAAYDGVSTASYDGLAFGTSFACPHVAGAAGVVFSAFPEWSGAEVRSFVEDAAIDKGEVGMDNDYGWGRLNLGPSPLSTCAYELDQTAFEYSAGPNVALVNVTTDDGCFWAAEAEVDWLTVSTDNGTGSGRVIILVDGNDGGARTGTARIAGETVTVNQQGADCSYAISPTSQEFPASGGDGIVAVTTQSGCAWTASSPVDWVEIVSGATGSGSGQVTYHVDTFDGVGAREAELTVAAQAFTVIQSDQDEPDRRVLVAGIAETAGAAGTRWKSNLAILNPSGSEASANLVYRHSDGEVERTEVIANGEIREYVNAAADFFGTPDSGGLVEVRSDVPLVVTARTFNDAPDGTFGQFLPGVTDSDGLSGSDVGVLSQLHSNEGFRTNVGFVNFGGSEALVRVRLYDGDGAAAGSQVSEPVGPGEWTQINRVFREAAAGECSGCYALVDLADEDGGPIWAYASVVDNGSGDPTTIPMEQLPGPTSEDELLVAGIAETAGAAGTRWRSDVAALNLTGSTVLGTVEYRYDSGTVLSDFSLGDGEQLLWEDIVSLLGVPGSAGAVAISADGPLVVTARTFNDSDDGTYGQFIPGLGVSAAVGSGSPAVLPQIKRTGDYRTNIGFTNYSDAPCDVMVNLVDADGQQLGSSVMVSDIPPGGWKQQNRIFREAGVDECELGYAAISVETEGCAVWAYASVVDNGSGDPTTIPTTVLFHVVP